MPVDDKIFQQMNGAQMIWYQLQTILDENEKFETLRDVAEHNAMFTNPEGVQKVREARENTYETKEEDFEKLLKEISGRELPKLSDEEKEIMPLDVFLREQVRKQNSYVDMELDEVKFVPFEE